MNNFSPDQMYDIIQARHEDIRLAEAARSAANDVRADKLNGLKALVTRFVDYARQSHPAAATPDHDTTQAPLRNKHA